MEKTAGQNRINNMSTLHLIGALFVMYGHHSAILGQPMITIFGCLIHAIGVKLIFLISGYLITKSLWRTKRSRGKATLTYGIKRLGRLYPEYIVCILFAAFIAGPLVTTLSQAEYWANMPVIKQYIFYNMKLFPIFYLPGVFSENIYAGVANGSLWTMPVEVVLYLIILAVFLITKNENARKRIYAVVTAAITIAFLVRIAYFPTLSLVWHGTDWIQALNVMPYFFIGGLAYLYHWERYANVQAAAALFLMFAGGVVFNSAAVSEIISLFVLSYLVISLMLSKEQKLTLPIVQGEYAYGMYLYGFIVQQCMMQYFFKGRVVNFASFHISFVVCVVITYFIAMFSYKIVYKPFSVLIKKCLSKLG